MIKTYIIAYDLITPGKNYDKLYEAIRGYGKWAKITESVWAVVTDQSAVQVRDSLKAFLDGNDRIFVVKSGVESAWANTRCNGDWLKNNL